MSDPKTLNVYAQKADDYARIMGKSAEDSQGLQAFLDAMPPQARILDIGCGPGTWAGLMAAAGHDVEAWDPVPDMVRLAAEKPGVRAREAGFEDLTAAGEYDGVWANFSLLHVLREGLPVHIGAMARALKPGGLFHIGMKTGEGMQRDALGRRYTYVTASELEGLLEAAGLRPAARWTGEDKGLDGTMAPWIVMQAVKHG